MTGQLIELRHPGGSKATVSTFGATVISFVDSHGIEKLFRSKTSPVDRAGPNQICAGIPIVWPTFGEPPKEEPFEKLKLHGFAHRVLWKALPSEDNTEARFELEPDTEIQRIYSPDFLLKYTVKLIDGDGLKCTLTVVNPGSFPLKFHALFHNYFKLPDNIRPDQARLPQAFKGRSYIDKTRDFVKATESRNAFTFAGSVDYVWTEAPSTVEVVYGDMTEGLQIATENAVNMTTWNPARCLNDEWEECEKDAWRHFVCIEPGHVVDFIHLQAGKEWTLSQTLRSKA